VEVAGNLTDGMEGGGEAGRGWAMMRQSDGGPSSVQQQTEHRGEEKRRLRGEAGCSGARGVFYRAGEGGGSWSEELDGGQRVRFEVGRFEDEGDMVRHRFIGQKEGGRAAHWFGSPRVEDGAATPTGRVAAAQAEEEDDSQRWARPGWPDWLNATWAGAERKQRRKWDGLQG
jgi:hypothetical protein